LNARALLACSQIAQYCYIGLNIFVLEDRWSAQDQWRKRDHGKGTRGKTATTLAWASPSFILLTYTLLLATRLVTVSSLAVLANCFRTRALRWQEVVALWWAGQLRGAVTVAVALAGKSLHHSTIVSVSISVVVLTHVVCTFTTARVMDMLGLAAIEARGAAPATRDDDAPSKVRRRTANLTKRKKICAPHEALELSASAASGYELLGGTGEAHEARHSAAHASQSMRTWHWVRDRLGWIWGEQGDTHSGDTHSGSAVEPTDETQELVVGSSGHADAEARISHEWGEGERSD
jgi:hypothetical protein